MWSPQARPYYSFGDRVRGQDQGQSDDRLEQADRRRVAEVAGLDADPVEVRGYHVGRRIRERVVEEQDLLESDRQERADVQHQQRDHRRTDPDQRDVPGLLQTVRAVDAGRLVELIVDRG